MLTQNVQKLKSAKPVVKTVKRWTNETERVLQVCFELTDWSVFEAGANDLDELTETVTSYISFCEDMCIPTRTYLTYNNDKPWFTAKLRQLCQAKEDAYSDVSSVWKGLKVITNYKTPSPSTVENQQLADDLNEFYCRFEKTPLTPPTTLLSPTPALQISEDEKPKITGLNDYRPVALTSVVMKSFEKLVLAYLKDITGPLLDPLQFAYRANRSVDDAVNMGLHFILQHLDKSGTYVRILFVDFSSAFNTIIPNLLLQKLTQLSVPTSICQWITSFLTDRQQLVKLGKFSSCTRTISTGAPQGCVLSPLLFSLYTNDCASKDPSVKLLKFADDTTVIGLIQDGDESAYRQEVKELTVCLTRSKTVEMTVDFRRNPPALPPLTIMDSTVKTVETFRFLGNTISQDLKWDIHIGAIVKKAQQRLFFLRQLRKFNLPQELLKQFHTAIIESVLCTSITVWFNSATKSDHRRLHRTVRTAERIIGTILPTLQELYLSRVSKKAGKITLDPSHPAHSLFELLPSAPEQPGTGTVSSLKQSIS
ncbi:hypothetical protein M9458_053947 [Cirrhinus mrigala]|uniref:Reverse transcriptase domain-containing protein n=1 Tax=Cirrhinus mrigala TaxID=683832 RepID=A0ABD0MLG8_CIRMR